jgi:hypothetical protein
LDRKSLISICMASNSSLVMLLFFNALVMSLSTVFRLASVRARIQSCFSNFLRRIFLCCGANKPDCTGVERDDSERQCHDCSHTCG